MRRRCQYGGIVMSIDPKHVCYGCFSDKEPGTVCPSCGFNESSERAYLAVPLGTILDGRYLIGKVLGIGGFGITYLGYDLTLDYKVAVKEYMPSGFATRADDHYSLMVTSSSQQQAYDDGLDKFLSEARTLAKFHNTPNIVSVQDFFKENNTAYFVMEYVDGESLKDYLDKNGGRVSYVAATKILMPIMNALSKVHAQGLIHRDISPDNISINSSGASKLLDFGAARSAYAENKSVSVILKHGLAPIEQYSNHGNMGPWTDVYAMGATLYRSITGILPPESIERIHADSIRTPSSMGIAIPPHAELALMKALAVSPENRFPNIEQFMDALNGKSAYAPAPAQMPVAPAAVPPVAPVAPVQPATVSMPQTYAQPNVPSNSPVTANPPSQEIPSTGYRPSQPVATGFGGEYAGNPGAIPVQPVVAPKKKGAGKGAVIGLIIGGVALILTIVGTATAISIANNVNSQPRHTTTETTDEGHGHFGSKETTYTPATSKTKPSESTRRTTESTASGNLGGGKVTTISSINASIWIPDGFVKNDKGFYTSTDGGFSVNYTDTVKDVLVYGVDDVKQNKDVFINYYLGNSVTETNSGEFTLASGVKAFEIDGEMSGAKFILMVIPAKNPDKKAGCYFISSWFNTDEAGGKIATAMKSFVATGDVNSKQDVFSWDLVSRPSGGSNPDVRMKLLFDPKFAPGFIYENDSVSVINNKNLTNKTIVMWISVDSNVTQSVIREQSKKKFEEEFKKNQTTIRDTKTSTASYNGVKWTIDTHDFGNFQAQSITAVYPNGMVVCIHAKCTNTAKSSMSGYVRELQKSIRLYNVG